MDRICSSNESFHLGFGEYDDDYILQRRGNITSEASNDNEKQRLMELSEILGSLDEYHTEKRSLKRESTLRKLFKAVSCSATGESGYEIVSQNLENILTACRFALRPAASNATEQYAACRVLEVVAVVLGANEEVYVEEIHKTLRLIVNSNARATAVRMAALRTMALATVVGAASDTETAEHLQDTCESLAQPVFRSHSTSDALRATAIDCWGLLATLADEETHNIANHDDTTLGRGCAILEFLRNTLDEDSTELRSAAGQCLALIHEARLHLGVVSDDSDVMLSATARRYQKGTWESSNWEGIMDEVQYRISELAVQTGHHMSKKAKKEQRATFREFQATIVDDEAPKMTIAFVRGGATIELQSWKEIIAMNFVRHCLQSGFRVQLLTNTTLQDMFGFRDLASQMQYQGAQSTLHKRLVLSKASESSKVADQDRRGRRDKRENVKNHFLTADE
jgi:hypothetical protein